MLSPIVFRASSSIPSERCLGERWDRRRQDVARPRRPHALAPGPGGTSPTRPSGAPQKVPPTAWRSPEPSIRSATSSRTARRPASRSFSVALRLPLWRRRPGKWRDRPAHVVAARDCIDRHQMGMAGRPNRRPLVGPSNTRRQQSQGWAGICSAKRTPTSSRRCARRCRASRCFLRSWTWWRSAAFVGGAQRISNLFRAFYLELKNIFRSLEIRAS